MGTLIFSLVSGIISFRSTTINVARGRDHAYIPLHPDSQHEISAATARRVFHGNAAIP